MTSIAYITRDIERALGALPSESYFIVANDGAYARTIKAVYPDFILLIESPAPLDTFELLEHPETATFFKKIFGKAMPAGRQEKPSIIVFKNTVRIEELCAKKDWALLNPPTTLAEKIENKITQTEWLGDLATLLPAFKILPTKGIKWEKKTMVLQWAHAHTGEGTIVVNDAASLSDLQKKFPDRPAKVSEFIKGPTFTVNVVVTENRASERGAEHFSGATLASDGKCPRPQDERADFPENNIAIGNVSYQITGMPPLTDSPFATVGNDWSLPLTLLNERHLAELRDMAEKIGVKMRDSGWKGLFGIDVIYDEERDQLKLIEINARQPASTTFESQLQDKFRGHGLAGATIFEAHLAALTDSPLTEKQIELNDGAQVVQRITKNPPAASSWPEKIIALNKAGYATIPYPNTKHNADFLRIQSAKGIMAGHGKFNARGQEIVDILEK